MQGSLFQLPERLADINGSLLNPSPEIALRGRKLPPQGQVLPWEQHVSNSAGHCRGVMAWTPGLDPNILGETSQPEVPLGSAEGPRTGPNTPPSTALTQTPSFPPSVSLCELLTPHPCVLLLSLPSLQPSPLASPPHWIHGFLVL